MGTGNWGQCRWEGSEMRRAEKKHAETVDVHLLAALATAPGTNVFFKFSGCCFMQLVPFVFIA